MPTPSCSWILWPAHSLGFQQTNILARQTRAVEERPSAAGLNMFELASFVAWYTAWRWAKRSQPSSSSICNSMTICVDDPGWHLTIENLQKIIWEERRRKVWHVKSRHVSTEASFCVEKPVEANELDADLCWLLSSLFPEAHASALVSSHQRLDMARPNLSAGAKMPFAFRRSDVKTETTHWWSRWTRKEVAVWGRAKQDCKTGKAIRLEKHTKNMALNVDVDLVKISRLWTKGIWHC